MSSTTAGKRPARDDNNNNEYDSDGWVVVPGARKKARIAPDTGSADELDEPVAVDGAVAAVDAVVQQASASKQPRLTAAQKRAKFLLNYSGMTPEEVLGECTPFSFFIYLLTPAYRQAVQEMVLQGIRPLPEGQDHRTHGQRRSDRASVRLQSVRPAVVSHHSGISAHKICRHPGTWVDRSDYEDSTGNLGRHILKCEPPKTPESEAITAFAAGSTYSAARVRYYLALWCARHHRPFTAVEDAEFRALLKMLYGRVEVPSRVTVSRDVQLIVKHCKTLVIALFEVSTLY